MPWVFLHATYLANMMNNEYQLRQTVEFLLPMEYCILCMLDHVTLESLFSWKAFSYSPCQTDLGGSIFFSFWLVLAARNGFEEISKCLKIKEKTGSICLQVVTFLKRKIKCLISMVDLQVTAYLCNKCKLIKIYATYDVSK